jgi:aryl-alcohol dehydrogenase-like predicted oxidoreductase
MSAMRYRCLGDSGLMVSIVGLGCNNFGRKLNAEDTAAVVRAALDAGVTLFDTADVYGDPSGTSEMFLGEALKGARDDVVLATKFGMDMGLPDGGARGSRRYIMRSVEDSLRRLRTDYIDLYQYHIPDGVTPVEETLRALDDLVRDGKVRYLGSSKFAGWQVTDADWVARTHGLSRFVSTQEHYNWVHRGPEKELLPACEKAGVGLLPFFPLESGLLTGVYRRDQAPPPGTRLSQDRYRAWLGRADWDTLEALEAYAADNGVTVLDVAIGGLAAQSPVASVIAGATTPEQVRANVRAGQWIPAPEQLGRLHEITQKR